MNKYIILLFSLFCFSCHLHATPVIINDTNDWDGYITFEKVGFIYYQTSEWAQRGANKKSGWEIVNFKPEIANCGTNTVTCTITDIGWFGYLFGGPEVDDEITFISDKLVVVPPKVSSLFGGKEFTIAAHSVSGTAAEFPGDGILAITKKITIQDTVWASASEKLNNFSLSVSGPSVFDALGARLGMSVGALSVVSSIVSVLVDVKTVSSINFYCTYAPKQRPTEDQYWTATVKANCVYYSIEFGVYDAGKKGFAPNGETYTSRNIRADFKNHAVEFLVSNSSVI